jgi:alkanesulfonate monooxygenase SsuD/methylene tetrahydromethanopterin reductase-like flavin-dependent oxidoreductase (luciferase family)
MQPARPLELAVLGDELGFDLIGVQDHPYLRLGIWVGAYKPRMIFLVGRVADGWVPSLGYLQPSDLQVLNERIDDEARNAGRDPSEIRRVVNVGDQPAELLVELTLEHGMDTYIVSGDDPDAMRQFAAEVAPAVREAVANAR